MNKETVYYQDGNVLITNSRAKLGATIYSMSNITSVAIRKRSANRYPGILIALAGLAILLWSVLIDRYVICSFIGV